MDRNKNTERQKFSQNAYRRSDIYGLLSSVYSQEPDISFIEYLNTSPIRLLLAKQERWDEEFWGQSKKKICEDLAVEYTRLFIGPKGHIPPFESLYNYQEGEIRQIWGSVSVEVKKIIEGSGLTLKNDCGGIPDHISIELEFMQKLVKKEAELWKGQDNGYLLFKIIEMEGKFIDEHLKVWVPEFCQRVIQAAKLDFYRNFAVLTEDFIKSEKKEVENLHSLLMG